MFIASDALLRIQLEVLAVIAQKAKDVGFAGKNIILIVLERLQVTACDTRLVRSLFETEVFAFARRL